MNLNRFQESECCQKAKSDIQDLTFLEYSLERAQMQTCSYIEVKSWGGDRRWVIDRIDGHGSIWVAALTDELDMQAKSPKKGFILILQEEAEVRENLAIIGDS